VSIWHIQARKELPALERFIYLNTGTAGPIPRCSAQAMEAEAQWEFEQGRANFATFGRVIEAREQARDLLAKLLNASPDEIALMHHTSEAVATVINAIPWQTGDIVVTTSLEHDAGAVPLALLRERYGMDIRFADIGLGERALTGLAEALKDGAKLVLLSHIVYSSGALLPLAEMVAMARQAGALVLVDGAQTGGAYPLDISQMDVDFYTISGQKWICGPEGTGALYVRKDRLDVLQPVSGSYFSTEENDFMGQVKLHPNAKRFETGMFYRPQITGFVASLKWTLEEIGVERSWKRSSELASYCREKLSRQKQIEVITPEALQSQLVSFVIEGHTSAEMHAISGALAQQHQIIIRSISHPPYCLRAALGWFNTEEDVDRLVSALASF